MNKEQRSLYNKEYRKNNIDYFKKYDYEYYRKNKERVNKRPRNMEKKKAYDKIYYSKNKGKSHQNYLNFKEKNPNYSKEQYKKNKEAITKLHKIYYNKNKDRFRKNQKEYYHKKLSVDKQAIVCTRLRELVKKAFKKYTKEGKIWQSSKYGIDYKAIIEHLKPFPEDIPNHNIHHKKALFTFDFVKEDGSTNLEEIKKAFAPENHKWVTIEEHKKIHEVRK